MELLRLLFISNNYDNKQQFNGRDDICTCAYSQSMRAQCIHRFLLLNRFEKNDFEKIESKEQLEQNDTHTYLLVSESMKRIKK